MGGAGRRGEAGFDTDWRTVIQSVFMALAGVLGAGEGECGVQHRLGDSALLEYVVSQRSAVPILYAEHGDASPLPTASWEGEGGIWVMKKWVKMFFRNSFFAASAIHVNRQQVSRALIKTV